MHRFILLSQPCFCHWNSLFHLLDDCKPAVPNLELTHTGVDERTAKNDLNVPLVEEILHHLLYKVNHTRSKGQARIALPWSGFGAPRISQVVSV